MGAVTKRWLVALALLSGCAASDEVIVRFRPAIDAPGSQFAERDMFRVFRPDPVLEACQPCEVVDWTSEFGQKRTLHLSTDTGIVLERQGIRRATVRERLPFGGARTYFSVEIETTPEARTVGESLSGLGGGRQVV